MPDEPWFRNPWVWLLIAIPAATIAGCIVTIALAISHPDYLVKDAESTAPTPEDARHAVEH